MTAFSDPEVMAALQDGMMTQFKVAVY